MKAALVCLAAVLALAGCGAQAGWIYEVNAKSYQGPKRALKIAITPFQDLRGQSQVNALWLCFIPPIPVGPATYERPDLASGFLTHAGYNAHPGQDYARALFEELRQNDVVQNLALVEQTDLSGFDLVLTGEINRAYYGANRISYFISFWGSWLWLLGLPIGTATNELDVVLTLKRPNDPAPHWAYRVAGKKQRAIGLYYNFAAELKGFAEVLREQYALAVPSLVKRLDSQPDAFWKSSQPPALPLEQILPPEVPHSQPQASGFDPGG